MTALEKRIFAAHATAAQGTDWERLIALFHADREAFYLLACEGLPEHTTEHLRALAQLASRVRAAVRETYEVVPANGGANLTSYSGTQTFIPDGLVRRVADFLREIDGKTTSTRVGKDYEGEAISEAEARFKLGDGGHAEREHAMAQLRLRAKPAVFRLDQDDLAHLDTQPRYVTYELLHCARNTLLAPTAVFRGLKRGGNAPASVNKGWALFGKPRQAFHNDGTPVQPRSDMVFVVYADEGRYVFDWDWVQEDPDRPGYPLGPVDERFEQEIKLEQDAVLDLPGNVCPGKFDRTKACYSSRGDCIFCYMTEAESYAVRINTDLTVFQQFGTNEHTGFKVKNVRRILETDKSIVLQDAPSLTVAVDSALLATIKLHPEVNVQVYSVLIEAMYKNMGQPPKVHVPPAASPELVGV